MHNSFKISRLQDINRSEGDTHVLILGNFYFLRIMNIEQRILNVEVFHSFIIQYFLFDIRYSFFKFQSSQAFNR
jgi:hypothetical protein